MPTQNTRPLRRGDLVEVRPAAEILATLDQGGALDGIPFMPEMLAHIGHRYRVSTRVEKICDTIHGSRSRRMHDTVYLEDLRCDGSGHGGCQAGCRLYWKEAWLTLVNAAAPTAPRDVSDESYEELARVAQAASTRDSAEGEAAETFFRCQATDALLASEPLGNFDVSQYAREVRSGNVGLGRLAQVALRALLYQLERPLIRLHLRPPIPVRHAPAPSEPEPLGLEPGDWVQVRTPRDIGQAVDEIGKNKGLWFDREMLPYCGGSYRVKARIERIVDDRTGRMIEIKRDCVVLEGVVCSGERSPARWLCPRAITPYWREAWLLRVDGPGEAEPSGPSESASAR
jgi:hypothetical protein